MKKVIGILSFLLAVVSLQVNAQQDVLQRDSMFVKKDSVKTTDTYVSNISEEECDDSNPAVLSRTVYYGFARQAVNEWSVGPNPTMGEVRINGDYENIVTVQVFSITGEMLMVLASYEADQPIDLSLYPSGIYFVRIVGNFNVSKTYKVMKR